MAKKGEFQTYYAKEESGKVVYEERKDCLPEIQKHIDLIEELKKSADIGPSVIPALEEVQFKIESLKYSDIPAEEVKKKLKAYGRVPIGEGKFMHLSSFVTSTGEKSVVKSEGAYLEQVQKMLKNTKANLANLLIFKGDDEHLQAFADELQEIEGSSDYKDVKTRMDHLTMSGIIKHYNQIKFDFLKSWLAPFEEQLGKPVEKMSPQDIQDALGKVENLKKQELEQIGMRLNPEIADDFRPYNKTMHDLMNGKTADFWGFSEYRDEFVELVKKIINRFSFKLESHYLMFQSSDKNMAFLVGFPDDTFETKKKLKSGKVGLIPHLKVFFSTGDGKYKELTREDIEKPSDYYRTLKTAVVPFLASLSMIVDAPLSQGFKDAFEMWV